MNNFQRQAFLGCITAVVAAGVAQAEKPARPVAPFKTLYSNDTTNITSCISPYHQLREPISDERLRATVDEARGVDVQMLQPGLGWIPWWQSELYSADDHYGYYQRRYGIKPNSFGRLSITVEPSTDGRSRGSSLRA